jgi:hypothetical protein
LHLTVVVVDMGTGLVYSHNVTLPKLLLVWRAGGVLAPSIAILSLIAPRELIDPSKGAIVYNGDMSSGRYPGVIREVKLDAFRSVADRFYECSGGRLGALSVRNLKARGLGYLFNNPLTMYSFLHERGIDVELPGEGDWRIMSNVLLTKIDVAGLGWEYASYVMATEDVVCRRYFLDDGNEVDETPEAALSFMIKTFRSGRQARGAVIDQQRSSPRLRRTLRRRGIANGKAHLRWRSRGDYDDLGIRAELDL